jgi:hypothetical protein
MALLSPPDTFEDPQPPVISWSDWYGRERRTFKQGQHILVAGPTGTGKTILARHVARIRPYVVVVGTKPRDDSLDAYEEEGYVRIDHWPPTRSDLRLFRGTGEVRFLLWPKISTGDLRAHRGLYQKALRDMFAEGSWCVVIDEGLWVTGRDGLDLGGDVSDMAYAGRSQNISLIILAQRLPPGFPVIWVNVSQGLFFHQGRTDDIRELASLGVYEPRDVAEAVKGLRGHQFLDLPVRAQADWSISEVSLAWL